MTSSPYFYPIAFVLAIALIFANGYYQNQKMLRDMRNHTGAFNFLDHDPGYLERLVSLDCYDLKFFQYAFGTGWWLGAILFLTMSLGEFHIIDTHLASKIVDILTSGYGMACIYIGFIGSIIFYIYYRTKLVWDQQLTINGREVDVLAYYIRKSSIFRNVVYLQTARGWKMLVPAAMEATYRTQDAKVLKQQRQYNEEQVEKLRAKLIKQGIPEKEQPYLVRYLVAGVCAFAIFAFVILFALNKY